MFQNVVSDDYENKKQYCITKCVDRPSLQQGRWLRYWERERLSCHEMCEGYCWELGGFLARSKKQKRRGRVKLTRFFVGESRRKMSPKRRICGSKRNRPYSCGVN